MPLHLNKILGLPNINHTDKEMSNFITLYTETTQALKGLQTDNTNESPMLLLKLDSSLLKTLNIVALQIRLVYFTSRGQNREISYANLNFILTMKTSSSCNTSKGKPSAFKNSYFEHIKSPSMTCKSGDCS